MEGRAVWQYRATFAALAAAICFFALLPFDAGEGGIPGPDLVVCLAAAWVLRRPDYVPVWLLIAVVLTGDVLLMRPLGLWTLVMLLFSEYLRRRVDHAESLPVWSEFGLVAACILVAFAANHLALVVLLVQPPPLWGEVIHAIATVVFYPLVVVFSQLIGVRRLAPGELDSLGTRA